MKKIPMWRRYDRLRGPDPKADIRAELRFHLDCKMEDHGAKPSASSEIFSPCKRQANA